MPFSQNKQTEIISKAMLLTLPFALPVAVAAEQCVLSPQLAYAASSGTWTPEEVISDDMVEPVYGEVSATYLSEDKIKELAQIAGIALIAGGAAVACKSAIKRYQANKKNKVKDVKKSNLPDSNGDIENTCNEHNGASIQDDNIKNATKTSNLEGEEKSMKEG